jgi:hypothetical protein
MTRSLRVAFDLDGVLADMESELARQAEALFGERVIRRLVEAPTTPETPSSVPPTPREASQDDIPPDLRLELTARQQRRLWRHVTAIEGFWESLKETEPGIVARLAAIASAHRWEVIFLTKRPGTGGVTAQLQSQRWLSAKGFALPSVYVVQGSRGRIAAALGLHAVIDDRPENCLDVVADSTARAVLVWRDDEKLLPAAARRLGIGVVKSVDESLSILSGANPANPESSGIVDRMKRLLRGKQPAGA